MTSRLSAYSKDGKYLTEFDATFSRGYKLNEFGEGSFQLSTYDNKASLKYLQFGNLIYCEHESLPPVGDSLIRRGSGHMGQSQYIVTPTSA
jgi:hypothetical protein